MGAIIVVMGTIADLCWLFKKSLNGYPTLTHPAIPTITTPLCDWFFKEGVISSGERLLIFGLNIQTNTNWSLEAKQHVIQLVLFFSPVP